MTDYRAGRKFRLKRRTDIARAFDSGRKRSDGLMTLIAVAIPAGGQGRFAVLVSRRHGGAVRRNRIKRLCREAFRLTRPELPQGWDYVILPRAGAKFSLAGLQNSLRALAPKVTRQKNSSADSAD